MIDIGFGDSEKRTFRLALWWARKKYADGKKAPEIHNDIANCGNPVIRRIHKLLYETADNIDEKYQNALIKDMGEFFLWIMLKDTAYRDPFFWIIKNILDQKDTLMPLLDEYYEEPENWYINRWTDTKVNTAKLRDEGKITDHELGPDENIFVPQHQYAKIHKIIDEETQKEKKRRGW